MAKDANDVTCAGAQAPVPMVGVVSSAKVEEWNDAYRVVDVENIFVLAAMDMELSDAEIVVVLAVANAITAMAKVCAFVQSVMVNKMFMILAQNVMAMLKWVDFKTWILNI